MYIPSLKNSSWNIAHNLMNDVHHHIHLQCNRPPHHQCRYRLSISSMRKEPITHQYSAWSQWPPSCIYTPMQYEWLFGTKTQRWNYSKSLITRKQNVAYCRFNFYWTLPKLLTSSTVSEVKPCHYGEDIHLECPHVIQSKTQSPIYCLLLLLLPHCHYNQNFSLILAVVHQYQKWSRAEVSITHLWKKPKKTPNKTSTAFTWLWATAKIKLGKSPKTGSHIISFSKLMIWWYCCMTSYRICKNWANGEGSSLVRPNKSWELAAGRRQSAARLLFYHTWNFRPIWTVVILWVSLHAHRAAAAAAAAGGTLTEHNSEMSGFTINTHYGPQPCLLRQVDSSVVRYFHK